MSAERPTFARLHGCCTLLWSQPQSLEERQQVGLDIPSRRGEKATASKVTSKIWTISSPADCEQSYHALECKTTYMYSNSVMKIITVSNSQDTCKALLTIISTHKNMQICNIF